MDPITVVIIALWAFNFGAGLMFLAHKLDKWNTKLDEMVEALQGLDLSADWAENIKDESGE